MSITVRYSTYGRLLRMKGFPCAETSHRYAGGTRMVELRWMRIAAGPGMRARP